MKRLLFLAGIMCLLYSCTSEIPQEYQDVAKSKAVTFHCDGILSSIQKSTSLSEAKCTDLFIYEDSVLLVHQVSTESNFGSPTVTMTYGTHNLTFIASASEGQVLNKGVWSCSKVKDTFAAVKSYTIDGSSQSSINVEMNRRVAKIQFTSTDKMPSTVSKVHIKVASHRAMDATLKGDSAIVAEYTMTSVSAFYGNCFSVNTFVMPESATTVEDCAVMIEFLTADDAVIYHYERTLSIKANYYTKITGAYFTGASNSISVNTEWDIQEDIPLFSSN